MFRMLKHKGLFLLLVSLATFYPISSANALLSFCPNNNNDSSAFGISLRFAANNTSVGQTSEFINNSLVASFYNPQIPATEAEYGLKIVHPSTGIEFPPAEQIKPSTLPYVNDYSGCLESKFNDGGKPEPWRINTVADTCAISTTLEIEVSYTGNNLPTTPFVAENVYLMFYRDPNNLIQEQDVLNFMGLDVPGIMPPAIEASMELFLDLTNGAWANDPTKTIHRGMIAVPVTGSGTGEKIQFTVSLDQETPFPTDPDETLYKVFAWQRLKTSTSDNTQCYNMSPPIRLDITP